MSSPAELFRVGENRGSSFNRFSDGDSLHAAPTLAACDFCSKAEQFVLIRYHHSSVHGGQPSNRVHRSTDSFLP